MDIPQADYSTNGGGLNQEKYNKRHELEVKYACVHSDQLVLLHSPV